MTCTDKPGVRNRGRPGVCFKKGMGVGIRIGIDIGKRKLQLGNQLTMGELNQLSKDSLRDIMLRRRRSRNTTTHLQGNISRMSKATLKAGLINDLNQTNQLRQG